MGASTDVASPATASTRRKEQAEEREAEEERGKLPKARGDAAAELLPE